MVGAFGGLTLLLLPEDGAQPSMVWARSASRRSDPTAACREFTQHTKRCRAAMCMCMAMGG